MENAITLIKTPSELPVFFKGPPLSEGPLPALFYFTLSAEQSFNLEPINRPALSFQDLPIRIFSATLPFHGDGFDPKHAVARWVEAQAQGKHILDTFFQAMKVNLDFLIHENIIDKNKIAVSGLSRGAFIATFLASYDQRIQYILGFAPLTHFSHIEKAKQLNVTQSLSKYDLPNQSLNLINKNLRFYIGNRDVLVGTDLCFSFIRDVTEKAYEQRIRSPQIELIIYPSIGHKGHGTPNEIFDSGTQWIKGKLL